MAPGESGGGGRVDDAPVLQAASTVSSEQAVSDVYFVIEEPSAYF
jgi:hypothetical protein